MHVVAVVVTAVCIATGIVGTVLPVVPGLVLAWAGVIVYGLLTEFGPVGWVVVGLETLLLALATYASFRVPVKVGAGRGVSRMAMAGGAAGAILGFFLIPIAGVVAGGVTGVFLVELARRGSAPVAWTSTKGALVAFGWSAAVQIGIGMAMTVVWLAWVVVDVVRG